jgi:hypothetical protein
MIVLSIWKSNCWETERLIGRIVNVSKKFDGLILPHLIRELNEKSRELNLEVEECSENVAEVTVMGGTGFLYGACRYL